MQNNLQLKLKNMLRQALGGSTLAEGLLHRWLHRSPSQQKGLLLLVLCLLPLFNLQAGTYTWNGGANGAWATAGNWLPAGKLASFSSSDIIIFNSSATVTGVPN